MGMECAERKRPQTDNKIIVLFLVSRGARWPCANFFKKPFNPFRGAVYSLLFNSVCVKQSIHSLSLVSFLHRSGDNTMATPVEGV